MTNPKYPNSCIVSIKQADICNRYMSQVVDGYGYNPGLHMEYVAEDGTKYYLHSAGSFKIVECVCSAARLLAEDTEAQKLYKKYKPLLSVIPITDDDDDNEEAWECFMKLKKQFDKEEHKDTALWAYLVDEVITEQESMRKQ